MDEKEKFEQERADRYWKDFYRYQKIKAIATAGFVIFLIGYLYWVIMVL